MKRLPLMLLSFLLFPVNSLTHGPTPQKGLESITKNGSVDAVWDVIKQFDAIASSLFQYEMSLKEVVLSNMK